MGISTYKILRRLKTSFKKCINVANIPGPPFYNPIPLSKNIYVSSWAAVKMVLIYAFYTMVFS